MSSEPSIGHGLELRLWAWTEIGLAGGSFDHGLNQGWALLQVQDQAGPSVDHRLELRQLTHPHFVTHMRFGFRVQVLGFKVLEVSGFWVFGFAVYGVWARRIKKQFVYLDFERKTKKKKDTKTEQEKTSRARPTLTWPTGTRTNGPPKIPLPWTRPFLDSPKFHVFFSCGVFFVELWWSLEASPPQSGVKLFNLRGHRVNWFWAPALDRPTLDCSTLHRPEPALDSTCPGPPHVGPPTLARTNVDLNLLHSPRTFSGHLMYHNSLRRSTLVLPYWPSQKYSAQLNE